MGSPPVSITWRAAGEVRIFVRISSMVRSVPSGFHEAYGVSHRFDFECLRQTPSLPVPGPANDAIREKQIPFRPTVLS